MRLIKRGEYIDSYFFDQYSSVKPGQLVTPKVQPGHTIVCRFEESERYRMHLIASSAPKLAVLQTQRQDLSARPIARRPLIRQKTIDEDVQR